MKRTVLAGLMIMAFAMGMLPGCGGGGGGGTPQPTQAVLTLSASGSLAGRTQIGGINVIVTLPDGVTLRATPDAANPEVLVADPGVVAAAGGAAGDNTAVMGIYREQSGTAPGRVIVTVANPNGFAAGDFATVTCDIAAGYSPTAADYGLTGFDARDLNGAVIADLRPGFTAEIR